MNPQNYFEDQDIMDEIDRLYITQAPLSPLRSKLQKAQFEWPPGGLTYVLPINMLTELVTESNVREELLFMIPRMENKLLERCIKLICSDSKKLFAILVCGFGTDAKVICGLLKDKVTDEDLPFTRILLGDTEHPGRKNHVKCYRADHRSCGIPRLSDWHQMDIQKLCKDQWLALAPVFQSSSGEIPQLDLHRNTLLPFTEDQELNPMSVRGGGYGEVWAVRIHPGHQNLLHSTHPKGPRIAVKRLFTTDKDVFEKELDMLSVLNQKNHRHLVKLLATYKYKHKYHLLFPFARANLRALWTFVAMPQWDRATFLWVISQLSGLVSALHLVHNFPTGKHPLGSDKTSKEASRTRPSLPASLKVAKDEEKYGRHGDIKPENILWDSESEDSALTGILILADFGLGRFHRLESRSRQDPAKINGSHTYAPPEITLGRPVSRAYDIWSLGCVFLEFITWLLEGSVGLDEFLRQRSAMAYDGVDDDTYYTIIGTEAARDAEVRRGVVSWMEYLRTSRGCSTMVKDLLDLVELDMLRINSKERIRAEDLDARLKNMVKVSKSDYPYLLG